MEKRTENTAEFETSGTVVAINRAIVDLEKFLEQSTFQVMLHQMEGWQIDPINVARKAETVEATSDVEFQTQFGK